MESASRMALTSVFDSASAGFKDKKKVYWVNQKTTEYYQRNGKNGEWKYTSSDEGDEWKPSEFDYVELRQNDAEKDKNGHYGPVIKG